MPWFPPCLKISWHKWSASQLQEKSFSDNLAAIGQPLQNHEFTAYLFGGLDTSYDAIVTSISIQIDKMTLEDIFNHLFAFEL